MYEQPAVRLRLHKETLRRIEPATDEAGRPIASWVPTVSMELHCPTTKCTTDP
jgi:hypothetical protein